MKSRSTCLLSPLLFRRAGSPPAGRGAKIVLVLLLAAAPLAAEPAVDPRAVTLAAIAELRSAQEVFPGSATDLGTVIDRLERSLVSPAGEPLHLDACHLQPHPEGLGAWIEARQAVHELGRLLAADPPPFLARTLARIRAAIADAYLLLADAAVQEVRALAREPSSASQLAVAGKELAAARAALAAGRFPAAMQSLRQAWQLAQLVLPDAGDVERPLVNVETPVDGSTLFSTPVTVAGMVQLPTAGPVGPDDVTVTVNGRPAVVANRGFEAAGVGLRPGLNAVVAVAEDTDGGAATACIAVRLDDTPGPRLRAVAGDGQTAAIGQPLPQPLVVRLSDESGDPIAGAQVVFRVVQGNGHLGGGARGEVAETDAAGEARADFVLGSRAGVGANRVRATAVGHVGEVIFSATATAAAPESIHVVAGDPQDGGVGDTLAQPLTVVVTDGGQNPVAGVAVSFEVTAGGGSVGGSATAVAVTAGSGSVGGSVTAVAVTDGDGRASVDFTLGLEPGLDNHRVEARFAGLPGEPATFRASGHVLGDPADTRLSGVVLDNQDEPVPGTTLSIRGTAIAATADGEGRFTLGGVPVGEVVLDVDAATTPRPGVWASLSFDLHTLPGIDNTLPRPIFILPLDVANGRVVGGGDDVTLTLPEVPGFELTVLAGSATFADGSPTGLVSVTPVHADKIPMAPGSGVQPRFVVTVQPPGTHFDPPAPVAVPNADGLAPGTVTEMLSFDHDLGEFVAIGTGTVSEDGLTVRSDPGFGIVKAGWFLGAGQAPFGAVSALLVEITDPPAVFVCNGGREARAIRAVGLPARDSVYSWTVGDAGVATLEPSGPGLCPDAGHCETTATLAGGGRTTATVTLLCTTNGQTVLDSVEIVAAKIDVEAVAPSELVVGRDLEVTYRIRGPAENGFDRAELRVRNRSDTLVFQRDVDAGPGTHTATWVRGKWNQAPHAGAFANPNNGAYTVEVVGIRGSEECVSDGRQVDVRLVLAADVRDQPPPGVTASAAAGLDDLLDALKVVVTNGASETVFSGADAITATSTGPGEVHLEVDAAGLGALPDGDYEVLFRDLRDALGNFADADGDPSNGIQPIRFDLSLW